MKKMTIVWLCCVSFLLILQPDSYGQQKPFFKYDVKAICGSSDGSILSSGTYRTAINIHNPEDTVAVYRVKFSVARPGEQAGPVTEYSKHILEPGKAIEIDCADIYKIIHNKTGFLKGFVTIETDVRLEVVAVYTAGDLKGNVRSIDVERISEAAPLALSCPDLKVEKIEKPVWDEANERTVVRALIINIGNAYAGPSYALAEDFGFIDDNGNPDAVPADTPALAPGASIAVKFHFTHKMPDPTGKLKVTADYKHIVINECSEDNNIKIYEDIG
jgi:hypothetical protein